jgi:hypothetical protein
MESQQKKAGAARQAPSRRRPLGRPDGWLKGFVPSYGIGYGSGGDAPKVCEEASQAEAVAAEPQAARALGPLRLALTGLVDVVGSVVAAILP